jgi:tetratricopeptide (TPR) repeat protein
MNRKYRNSSAASRRPCWSRALAATGLLAALFATSVYADEAADVSKLLRGGQLNEAMSKADAYLAQHPRDAQMRFLKGVILTEQNRQADAISVFTKLTEDYPDLPEPYNNLAVLYAGSGQYDKARAALENAIRTNPSYATAYENLGDIHARLASQAYDKALQLDSANNGAKSKLTLLRSLAVTGSKPAASPVPAAGTKLPPAPPVVVAQAPKTVAAAPAPAPAAAVPASKPAAAPAPVPAVSAKAEPAKPAPSAPPARSEAAKPTPPSAEARASKPAKVADEGESERSEVINTVHAWAKAWSARDVKGYLNYYASDFQTPNGEPRKAWAAERETRIAGKGSISVRIESPVVSIDGNTATVKFRQNYVSDRLTASSRKTLVLVKHGGKWHIKQERTGN